MKLSRLTHAIRRPLHSIIEGEMGGDDGGDNNGGGGGTGNNAGDAGGDGGTGKELANVWRTEMAPRDNFENEEDHKKALTQLERFQSMPDMFKSYRALQDKMASGAGEVKVTAPIWGEEADADQVSAYRKELGIPEKREDYKVELPDGLVIPDDDQDVVDIMVDTMHGINIAPAQATELIKSFYTAGETIKQAQFDIDTKDVQEATATLKQEWGRDEGANKNALKAFVNRFPKEMQAALFEARLPTGKKLLNDPESIKILVDIERSANPTATMLSSDGNELDLDAEIAEIEKKIGTAEWYSDHSLEQRHRELLSARIRRDQNTGKG